MKDELESCKKGIHDLIKIYVDAKWDSDNVVRWCKNCGGIVVDVDYDGRTHPGRIMNMRFPNTIKSPEKSEYVH